MQVWYKHQDNIPKLLLMLSKDKRIPAIVVTTKTGERIAAEKYDAAATQVNAETIHAFLRIGKIFYENDDDLFYDLEHIQLYPEDIQEIAVCGRFVSESETPENGLAPGMKVHITRNDLDQTYDGELTAVTFLDVVIKTADSETSIPVSKINTIVVSL